MGEERARTVGITGGTDPILPTPFRIGETSAAALAVIGLAVSDLWGLRTGRRQEVSVDTRQATASLPPALGVHRRVALTILGLTPS
jgi:hypothetical protein